MAQRYYICPVVVDPRDAQNNLLKTMLYPHRSCSAVSAVGRNWGLVRVDADDFAAIDADPQCVDILEKLSDISGATTRAEIIAWLRSRTVANVPAAARTRIRNRLTAVGVGTTGITLETTLLDVVRLVHASHGPGRLEDL